MELWIRSQDREILTKVIDIYKQADTNEIWAYSDRCIKNCLGIYKTKERALEVLDEIQKIIGWLQNDMKHTTIGDMNNLKGCFENYVYKMPKE